MNIFIKNKKGEPSVTLTAFVVGFITVLLKLILSGVSFGDFKLETFSGSDFAVAIGALGGVYVLNKKNKSEGT